MIVLSGKISNEVYDDFGHLVQYEVGRNTIRDEMKDETVRGLANMTGDKLSYISDIAFYNSSGSLITTASASLSGDLTNNKVTVTGTASFSATNTVAYIRLRRNTTNTLYAEKSTSIGVENGWQISVTWTITVS